MEFSDESLIKLALFYGVATNYLLGLADYSNRSGAANINVSALMTEMLSLSPTLTMQ